MKKYLYGKKNNLGPKTTMLAIMIFTLFAKKIKGQAMSH